VRAIPGNESRSLNRERLRNSTACNVLDLTPKGRNAARIVDRVKRNEFATAIATGENAAEGSEL
jgi:hypothetical protein